jgi:dTDP-4-dehydrorhamnose 3,5-epimerase-like enzyme
MRKAATLVATLSKIKPSDFFYKCDDLDRPSDQIVVRCAIGINWSIESPVLSARDAAVPLLANVEALPIYGSV